MDRDLVSGKSELWDSQLLAATLAHLCHGFPHTHTPPSFPLCHPSESYHQVGSHPAVHLLLYVKRNQTVFLDSGGKKTILMQLMGSVLWFWAIKQTKIRKASKCIPQKLYLFSTVWIISFGIALCCEEANFAYKEKGMRSTCVSSLCNRLLRGSMKC